jgi:hypothetical protein
MVRFNCENVAAVIDQKEGGYSKEEKGRFRFQM